MNKFVKLGQKIYNTSNIKDFKRFLVFIARVFYNKGIADYLLNFFQSTKIRKDILEKEPFLIELATRHFLYAKSTFE